MDYIKKIINIVRTKLEYQAAKAWARRAHPGWVFLVARHKTPELRVEYMKKILAAYRIHIKRRVNL